MEATKQNDTRWSVFLLGPFELRIDGRPVPTSELGSRKQRQLLKLLLLERGRLVSTDRIVDMLWDDAPRSAERHVATLVSRLRRAVGRTAVEGGPDAYRIRPPDGSLVDLEEAERLSTEAERRLARDEPMLARTAAERAVALLERGVPLEDEPYAEWVEAARSEAARLLRRARMHLWRAALATSDPAAALAAAEQAIADDPLDEEAFRAVMRSHAAAGAVAQALTAYERLRKALADELDLAPDAETERVRNVLLAGRLAPGSVRDGDVGLDEAPPGPLEPAPAPHEALDPAFVGREEELQALSSAWKAATLHRTGLLLLEGEAGIGKSTLARRAVSFARSTGGLVLDARCYGAERSLFLQPIAEAVRPLVVRSNPSTLRALVGDAAHGLLRIVPELAAALGVTEPPSTTPELEHRRAFDAGAHLLRELAARQPVLLFLDDLHSAGDATIEFLHYLARRQPPARLLVIATVRVEEGAEVRRLLGDVATTLHVGPLPPTVVRALAAAMGHAGVADDLLERARGHPLFVVEMLRSLADRRQGGGTLGASPIPESLRSAVLGRTERAGAGVRELLSAAAVLGSRFDLASVAALVDVTAEEAIRRVERAQHARLVTTVESEFSFSNDLIHEILYEATPLPIRVARHRTAAAQATRPEAVAHHAHAAGDWAAAARAWHEAASAASASYANRDAERLLDLALEALREADDPRLEAQVLIARGQARERLARYTESFDDHAAARDVARRIGARAIEMRALREMGGDPSVALGRPVAASVQHLEEALAIADALGEHAAAVDILSRLAILETNRLRSAPARRYADSAVERARATGDELALVAALDGRKSVAAYTGDVETLERAVTELAPLLERRGTLWVLQWTVFESSFGPFARGDWEAALRAVERALDLNVTSGYHAYQPMFLAKRAWIEGTRGAYGRAIEIARRASALAAESQHPWWIGFADAVLGRILLNVGAQREAAEVLEHGLGVAERDGAELYVLRCLGPLAEAEALLGRAEQAAAHARRVETLVLGDGCGPLYLHAAQGPLGAARAWLLVGRPDRASPLLQLVREAASVAPWVEPLAQAELGLGEAEAARGRGAAAMDAMGRALDLATRVHMPGIAADAHVALAAVHHAAADEEGGSRLPDERAAGRGAGQRHAEEAEQIHAALRATLSDTEMQRAFDERIARRSGGAVRVRP